MIFYLSNMNDKNSSKMSKGLVEKSVTASFDVGSKIGIVSKPSESEIKSIVTSLHTPVRKVAHFTEYLILSLLLYNALVVSGVSKNKIFLIALLICFLYSCSDEIHQLFINGRAGKLYDVVIDTTGSLVGLVILKVKKCI